MLKAISLGLAFGLFCLVGCAKKEPASDFVVFGARGGCVIAIRENPAPAERRAAELIQETLAAASGRPRSDFPLIRQTAEEWARPARNLGSTLLVAGTNQRRPGEARLAEKVWWRVSEGAVEISSYPADAIEAAAASFLREAVGVRWFMPGELGAHVPAKSELRLSFGEHSFAPSYVSRNLGLGGGQENEAWWRRNRLRSWFKHGHAMTEIFRPAFLRIHPEFVPLVNGAKLVPAGNDGNWQPNIAADGAAEHAAAVLRGRREFSSAIGLNDSIRFDQSVQSRAMLGEDRWFRQRPDYSKLYFSFVNDVAKRVPGRYLGAYAYDWTENTPGFPIERNVVPYLTADRSEWFDPEFAEADQALIKRWAAAGPEAVGIYDYYYGAPFLVPRPTLYAVTRAIPFASEAGVRGFYAEVYPNWGLDGPKAWLAAELLWDAKAKPAELLDIYYRDFWRESSAPMREFYEICDRQWQEQPKPSYWLKYFKDEHQHLLFPSAVRQKLRGLLEAARTNATTDLTRRRVEFASEAFAVTEAFCAWEEAKDKLSRAALAEPVDAEAIRAAWKELETREQELKATHARVAKAAPLAVKAAILPEYSRNDPRLRAAWRLLTLNADGVERVALNALRSGRENALGATRSTQRSGLVPSGKELLQDAALAQVQIRPPGTSFDLEWVTAGAWRGHGEPWEGRRIHLRPPSAERVEQSVEKEIMASSDASRLPPGASLIMRGCKQETFSQLVPAEAGKWYVAKVKVRAKVSPGNMTFLILNFQDAAGRALGVGVVDRLPVGEWGLEQGAGSKEHGANNPPSPGFGVASEQPTDALQVSGLLRHLRQASVRSQVSGSDGAELIVWAQAPKNAKAVGLGVRALNQVGDDYAAFSSFSLCELTR